MSISQAVFVRPVRPLSFGPYALVVSLLFALSGLGFGVVGLVGSLLRMHVFFQIFSWNITGLTAGIAGLFIMPALFALGGFVISLITYPPLNWIIRRL